LGAVRQDLPTPHDRTGQGAPVLLYICAIILLGVLGSSLSAWGVLACRRSDGCVEGCFAAGFQLSSDERNNLATLTNDHSRQNGLQRTV